MARCRSIVLFALSLAVIACGSKDEKKSIAEPASSKDFPAEQPADAGALAIDPSLPPAGPAPPPDPAAPVSPTRPARPPITIAGNCVEQGSLILVKLDGDVLKTCVDSDSDDEFDKCATWSRSRGTLFEIADATSDDELVHKPLELGDNHDDRLELLDPQIEVCPPDRICVKLHPRVPTDGDITGLAADASYRNLAVALRESSEESGHVEIWDLVAGRARPNKVKFRKLEEDTTYTFDTRFVGANLIALASRSDNHHGQGVIAGPDGTVRGELANGSRFIETSSIFELTPGTLALLDLEAPGIPYAVYTQSATTGRVLRKFTVAMDMDGDDDDAHMHVVSPTMLAVTQWSTELRLDLIDLTTGRQQTFRVPGC